MSDEYPPSLAAALARLQTKLPRIAKSETAKVTSPKGSYSYTYAGLADISAQVLPLLGAVGLSFMSVPTFDDNGRYVLRCTLMHTSGESQEGVYLLPTSGTPQVLGSAMTYGRRYILCAMTGVAPDEDDDGAAAEAAAAARPRTAQRRDTQARATNRAAPPRAEEPPLPDEGAASAPPETTPNGNGPTPAQTRKLAVMFSNAGIAREDREKRLRISSQLVKRDLSSWNDMTRQDARDLIETLEDLEKQGPLGEMVDALLTPPADVPDDSPLLPDDPDLAAHLGGGAQ